MFFNTYTNATGAYSIDMLIRWVNEFKIKGKVYPIDDFKIAMGQNVWGSGKNMSAPVEVLLHPEKHKDDHAAIMASNLKYPILFTGKEVVDGYHRIAKTMMLGLPTILAIYVPDKVWRSCYLTKHVDDVDNMTAYGIMELYDTRFRSAKNRNAMKSAVTASKKSKKDVMQKH